MRDLYIRSMGLAEPVSQGSCLNGLPVVRKYSETGIILW